VEGQNFSIRASSSKSRSNIFPKPESIGPASQSLPLKGHRLISPSEAGGIRPLPFIGATKRPAPALSTFRLAINAAEGVVMSEGVPDAFQRFVVARLGLKQR
jgi:hypothetical protein